MIKYSLPGKLPGYMGASVLPVSPQSCPTIAAAHGVPLAQVSVCRFERNEGGSGIKYSKLKSLLISKENWKLSIILYQKNHEMMKQQ